MDLSSPATRWPLAWPSPANSSPLAVLGCVLVHATATGLELAATDLERAVRLGLPATVTEPGAAAVPARLFGEWLAAVDGAQVEARLTRDSLTLRCGRSHCTIKCLPAADFPLLPEPPDRQVTMDAAQFARAVERTTFAASQGSSRPALTGVRMELAGGCLTLAATDGYRLSVVREQLGGDASLSAIIPAETLAAVGGLAKTSNGAVGLALAANQAHFEIPQFGAIEALRVASQLIDAKFPDYTAIIPKTSATTVTLAVADLRRAVALCDLFARDAAHNVRLEVVPASQDDPAHVNVFGVAAETGDGLGVAQAEVSGPGLQIAFNARYLLDLAEHAGADRLEMALTDKARPLSAAIPGGDGAFTHVIMPMQLSK